VVFGKKKKDELGEELLDDIETAKQHAIKSLTERLGSGSSALVEALLNTSDADDGMFIPDQAVELSREMAEKALAQGPDNQELLPAMTNLDHPIQAATLASDLTQLELMRAWGLPEQMYLMIRGNGQNQTGYTLYMKSLMGVVYPGLLAFLHPRSSILGYSRDKAESLAERIRNGR
jgi:hypothetical protein